MKPIFFQMSTIFFLICMIVFIFIFWGRRGKEEKAGHDIWLLKSQRFGPSTSGFLHRLLLHRHQSDEVGLEEGAFYMGNGVRDDIFLDTKEERVRVYLNVAKEKIYLTVLKGSVKINGYTYKKDPSRQLIIQDYTEVFVHEAKLTFQRREVSERC